MAFYYVIISVAGLASICSAAVAPYRLDVTIGGWQKVALWTDMAEADFESVFSMDRRVKWERSDVTAPSIDVVSDPTENGLFLFECLGVPANVIGQRSDVTDVCLCYYDNDVLDNSRGAVLYPCDSVTNARKVKQDITGALMEQGKWRNLVYIGDDELLETWTEAEEMVSTADLACDTPVSEIGDTVADIHYLGDYINVIIDCPLEATTNIMEELNLRSTAQINHISYNMLFLDIEAADFAGLYTYTRDGDDVVIPQISYREIPIATVFQEVLSQTPGSFPLLSESVLHWCVTSCFLGAENLRTTPAWDHLDQVLEYYAVLLPNDFIQFHGRHMFVVCETYKPFCYHEIIDGEAVYFGIEVQIVQALSEKFNFTFHVGPSNDGNWGVGDENGTWNGMVGMVKRQEADVAVAGITVSPSRDTVIDYLFPHFESPSAVILKLQQFKWFYFIKPFAYYLWVVMLVLPLFVTFTLTFIHAFRELRMGVPYDRDMPEKAPRWTTDKRGFSCRVGYMFLNNAFLLYGCQVLQGNVLPGKAHSVRFVVGTFWLVAIMMAAVYSGNLTASLAVKDVRMPFETLGELAADEQYIFQIEAGTFREQLFRDATRGVYKRLWDKILKDYDQSVIESSVKAKENVLLGGYTYTGSKINLIEFIRDIKDCDLVLLREEYYKAGFGVVVKQGMPFTRHYDLVVKTLADTGIIQRWTLQYSTKDTCAALAGQTSVEPIRISDISLILEMLLGVPLTIAFSVLLAEIVTKFQPRKRFREFMEERSRKGNGRLGGLGPF